MKMHDAVAHAMLVTVYHLLARRTTYLDPGSDYYDRRPPYVAGPFRRSNARAIAWYSNPRRERSVESIGDFLSKGRQHRQPR